MTNIKDRLWRLSGHWDDCWEWLGSRTRGYGMATVNGKQTLAHRAAYEAFIGPIPDGLVLDHLCGNRGCINPEHLEPVTHQVNIQRGFDARPERSECSKGHPLDESNTYITPDGYRRCRYCRTDWSRQANARRRAKRKADA